MNLCTIYDGNRSDVNQWQQTTKHNRTRWHLKKIRWNVIINGILNERLSVSFTLCEEGRETLKISACTDGWNNDRKNKVQFFIDFYRQERRAKFQNSTNFQEKRFRNEHWFAMWFRGNIVEIAPNASSFSSHTRCRNECIKENEHENEGHSIQKCFVHQLWFAINSKEHNKYKRREMKLCSQLRFRLVAIDSSISFQWVPILIINHIDNVMKKAHWKWRHSCHCRPRHNKPSSFQLLLRGVLQSGRE